MKLKKNIFEKYNFSHTNIINIKSYLSFLKQSNKLKLLNFESSFQSLKTIELNLKKVLKIIFEFHKLNKNIVFVGFPDINSYKFSLLFNKFNYKFLKKKVWVNGLLSNTNSLIYYLNSKRLSNISKKNNLRLFQNLNNLIELKKLPDLIVVFSTEENLQLINESNRLKIPIIAFNNNSNSKLLVISIFNFKDSFSVKLTSKFFYFLISSIFVRDLKKSIK
jgi:hypothetical protein